MMIDCQGIDQGVNVEPGSVIRLFGVFWTSDEQLAGTLHQAPFVAARLFE